MTKQEIIQLLKADGVNSKKKVIEILEQDHIEVIDTTQKHLQIVKIEYGQENTAIYELKYVSKDIQNK